MERIKLKRLIVVLFLISLIIYNISLLLALKNGLVYLGDEPHYLLITHSLVFDKDLNLRNNYLNGDYKSFYPGELGFHAHYGKKGENFWYSFHLPALPVFLIPFYWFSLKLPILMNYLPRALITLFVSFSGVQLFLLLQRFGISRINSLLVWLIYSFSSPVLFYSFHIYPDPVALSLSIYLIRKFFDLNYRKLDRLFIPLAFFILPWLGAKYILTAIPILLLGLYISIKRIREFKIIIYSFLSLLISYIIFLSLLYQWFGSFSTLSLYHGVLTDENVSYIKDLLFKSIPFTMRLETFLGYLYDQRDGLLFYSPIYFFFFPGLFEMWKRRRLDTILILFISIPFIVNYSFLTHRGGASPQARPILPVFYIFPIFLSFFVEKNRDKFFRAIFYFSCLLSIIFAFILLKNPLFLYQPTTHEVQERSGALFNYLSNFFFYFPSLLPSYIKSDTSYYLPNYIWLIITVIFVFLYLIREIIKTANLEILAIYTILAILSVHFVLFPHGFLEGSKKIIYDLKTKVSFHSIPENIEIERDFIKVNSKGKFKIPFTSFKKIEKFRINYRGDGKIFVSNTLALKGESMENPKYLRIKGRYLYVLRVFSYGPMVIEFYPKAKGQ